MIDSFSRGLTLTGVVGAGLAAGVYLAFSTFVMPGLRRTSHSQAISAMSAINKAAPANPLLMVVPFGTGIVCVLLLIAGVRHRDDPAAVWQIVGAALYLVSVLILVGYHIPHNDQLMKVDPGERARYLSSNGRDNWSADDRTRAFPPRRRASREGGRIPRPGRRAGQRRRLGRRRPGARHARAQRGHRASPHQRRRPGMDQGRWSRAQPPPEGGRASE